MAAVRKVSSNLRLPPLPSVKDLLRLYRLRAFKELSQNFLLEQKLTDKIVRSAGNLQDGYVCEVGPGPGGITRSIMRHSPKKLIVVEKDRRFLPTLELLAETSRQHMDFNIILGDILKTNLEDAFSGAPKVSWHDDSPPVHLIGNLPFSVSTILIIRWLEDIYHKRNAFVYGRTKMTLTFQKEVAERMAAPILSPQRCRLSVMCQNWCRVYHRYNIPGRAFVPKPDVDVGIVTLVPLKEPVIPLDFKLIEKVLRQVFHLRQKYSIRGAQSLFPKDCRVRLASKMYKMADINPQIRPFEISIEEFKRLCYAYQEIIKENPEVADYDLRAPKNKAHITVPNNVSIDEEDTNVEC